MGTGSEDYLVFGASQILGFFIGLVSFLYWWGTKTYGKYEAKGLFSLKPIPFMGNNWDKIAGKITFYEACLSDYEAFKGHRQVTYNISYCILVRAFQASLLQMCRLL